MASRTTSSSQTGHPEVSRACSTLPRDEKKGGLPNKGAREKMCGTPTLELYFSRPSFSPLFRIELSSLLSHQ